MKDMKKLEYSFWIKYTSFYDRRRKPQSDGMQSIQNEWSEVPIIKIDRYRYRYR